MYVNSLKNMRILKVYASLLKNMLFEREIEMSQYKDTLNLPKTEFPMQANLVKREPELIKRWQEMNIYEELKKSWGSRQSFVLHDGPPYANGSIHIGHALNKTLKDIINKSKMLSGFATPYVPGWDCHGLPIELGVEKKYGKPGDKITAKEFRQHCQAYAQSQLEVQRKDFIRLGIIADWQNPYITMDYKFEANIIRSLGKILQAGAIVPGYKPVFWCLDCGSALALAEVEYTDKTSPSIDVRFTVTPAAKQQIVTAFKKTLTDNKNISIPIWTTTPWTLPANEGVSLHPEINYQLLECQSELGSEYLIIAEPLVTSTMERYGITQYGVVASCKGKMLENLMLQHPFYDKKVPVVLGDHVTVDSGTGAVHTAPAHGQDDYQVSKKYNLPVSSLLTDRGCYKDEVELFAKQHIYKANPQIIEVLKQNQKLLVQATIQHSYPHCWRHKTPLIFRATPQWFISMDNTDLRDNAMAAIEKVKWIPERGQARIREMVQNNPDWCISRQRTWYTPITLFIHHETGELHPKTPQFIEEIAKSVEQQGIEAWYELNIEEFLGSEASNYRKISDVLDVWFDSGVTHACVLKARKELHYPADLYLEGSDQHRGWFQSSLLTSVAMNGIAPYKAVLTHGYTVDSQGRKMSKSLGNVISPEEIVNSLGADILRLWVSSTDYKNDQSVSHEIFKRTAEAYRRIRNTARYLLANTNDFDPKQHAVPSNNMLALDLWAIDKTAQMQEEICQCYENYQFHMIYQKLHNFCTVDMGSFYLDIIKDRQYTMPTNSLGRRSAQTAMYYILEAMVRWLAPILTFTAEEIWQYIPGKQEPSVFFSTWYQLPNLKESKLLEQFDWTLLMKIRDVVNKELEQKRAQSVIGSGLEANVKLYCQTEIYNELAKLGDELRFLLITSSAEIKSLDNKPSDASETEISGLALVVNCSKHEKCSRCWHRRAEVGHDQQHPELCERCVTNITSAGEQRQYA